ncbi:methyl-accepting chemotaxis protein [Pantoea sp.]|uniref:methyl-accepting chemotaxis protein n=1 Tax=Pantoea sp. TaxID=69393 RepID=UPI0028AA3E56|nr:methyl-accepting chemotaxis protein [Pantoea sp.]
MNNIRTSVRLGSAFALMMLMTLALTFFSIRQFNVMGDTTDIITDKLIPQTELTDSLLFYAVDMSRLARNIILTDDKSEEARFRQDYDAERGLSDRLTAELPQLITSEKGKRLVDELKRQGMLFFPFMDEVVSLGVQDRNEEAKKLLFGPRYQTQLDYMSSLKRLQERQKVRVSEVTAQAQYAHDFAVSAMLTVCVLVILLGTLLAWLITRSITRPLNVTLAAAQRIARGDLSQAVPVSGRDETGRLLTAVAEMQDSLAQTVSAVRRNAECVATASLQIAQGNSDLSQRTEEQASALEQTAATMSELSVTVRNNADNARQAAQLAVNVREVARQGNQVTANISGTMRSIGESSSRISDITSVIDSIAFQTNILALNAAVEAARAGEQGRGFAVVAGEVRTLASRSATAAGEIRQLIEANSASVSAGSALADRSVTTMADIVSSVGQLSDTVEEITAASAEQARGIEQVGIAVTEMDGVTQQNASLVEESASASQSLREQASLLLESVSVFTLAAAAHPVAIIRTAGVTLSAGYKAPVPDKSEGNWTAF